MLGADVSLVIEPFLKQSTDKIAASVVVRVEQVLAVLIFVVLVPGDGLEPDEVLDSRDTPAEDKHANGCAQCYGVDKGQGEAPARKAKDSAGRLLAWCWWQDWAHSKAVDTGATVLDIGVVALTGSALKGLECLLRVFKWKVDLERRAHWDVVATHELDHVVPVGCTAANHIHDVSISSSELDVFATIKEARPIGFGDKKIDFGDDGLFGSRNTSLGDIEEGRLVWGAGERAEKVDKVGPTRRADRDHRANHFRGCDQVFDLVLAAARLGIPVSWATCGHQQLTKLCIWLEDEKGVTSKDIYGR